MCVSGMLSCALVAVSLSLVHGQARGVLPPDSIESGLLAALKGPPYESLSHGSRTPDPESRKQPPSGQLTFTAPAQWKPRPAASTMRVAEFVLPKAEDDPEDGDVVIYYFGGQGGDVEANIDRWLGQMQQPDGRASKDVARRSTQTVNGLQVTLLEVSGTYVAEVRPGATEHFNKPGFRMRTAVVPTPRGPYFIKMLGPDKTVQQWAASFAELLSSLKF